MDIGELLLSIGLLTGMLLQFPPISSFFAMVNTFVANIGIGSISTGCDNAEAFAESIVL